MIIGLLVVVNKHRTKYNRRFFIIISLYVVVVVLLLFNYTHRNVNVTHDLLYTFAFGKKKKLD